MLFRSSILAGLAATATADTVHSVVVFTRHGDRTSKFYPGYTLTNLGSTQVFESGNFYRQRYLTNTSEYQIAGISQDRVVPSQVWASAPDQSVLYQTATNFLQGLYPPLGSLNQGLATEELTNGTSTEDPLNGYQFILIHGEEDNSPDTIWIKGDDQCPAWTTASRTYRTSDSYVSVLNTTRSFYSQFEPLLNPILGAGNVTFAHAYEVFDLLNTASIHNASVSSQIDASALDQARYLANEWEWNMNYNTTQPSRSVGGSALAGGILAQMDAAVKTKAVKQKFNLMAGSYDTFLAFFGLANLTSASTDFYGLPNYAATMAFELFSEGNDTAFPANVDNDLKVRFLFRNGSGVAINSFPMFGQQEKSLSYGDFRTRMEGRAVTTVEQWCSTCGSLADFCVAANGTSAAAGQAQVGGSGGQKLSNAAAGGIGAGVTLAVVAVLAGLVALVMRKRARRSGTAAPSVAAKAEKRGSGSETDSV
ncbi:Lysosomal acid phosphatase [Sphaceloma murrayae]|uniref:Lysosomal acid phosphatase n=1 Tax=Sphaceloma murrayae TaxID=2082308 RepID=A0A2K1QU24_9PEZI|nr:Lysosomal acid phosphatase [Sphaceloma murrayae]